MKGKGDQQTFWLVGESADKLSERSVNRERKRALINSALLINGKLDNNGKCLLPGIPRSSLKNKNNLVRSPLPRCSSLESPKKLRFASGEHIQHQYRNDSLLEVITDCSPCKKSSGSLVENSLLDCCSEALRTSSTSCPCIENLANSTATLAHSQLSMLVKDDKPSYLSVPSLYTCTRLFVSPQIQTISAPVSPNKRNTGLKSVCECVYNEDNPWNDVTPLLRNTLIKENRI